MLNPRFQGVFHDISPFVDPLHANGPGSSVRAGPHLLESFFPIEKVPAEPEGYFIDHLGLLVRKQGLIVAPGG